MQDHLSTEAHGLIAAPRTFRGSELAADLLTRLFRRLPMKLSVRLWDDATLRVGCMDAAAPDSRFALVFRNPEAVCATVLGRDPLRFAEAYFCGELDIDGDFFAALELKKYLQAMQLTVAEQIAARRRSRFALTEQASRRTRGRRIARPFIFTTTYRMSSTRYGWIARWCIPALILRTPQPTSIPLKRPNSSIFAASYPYSPETIFSTSAAAGVLW
jgi:hypothetical protein